MLLLLLLLLLLLFIIIPDVGEAAETVGHQQQVLINQLIHHEVNKGQPFPRVPEIMITYLLCLSIYKQLASYHDFLPRKAENCASFLFSVSTYPALFLSKLGP